MSVQAVKWLGGFFGVNIAGKPAEGGPDAPVVTPTATEPPARTMLNNLENTLFGGPAQGEQQQQQEAPVAAAVKPSGQQQSAGPTNYYVYSDERQRWEPSPDAPPNIQEDYARTLRELEEAERPKPPTAPPPPAAMTSAPPTPGSGTSRYAPVNFFDGTGTGADFPAPPPPLPK